MTESEQEMDIARGLDILRELRRFLMHSSKGRPLPSIEAYRDCVLRHGATPWYAYAYERFEDLGQVYFPYQWVRDNISRESRIVETGCGAGGALHMLWHEGFNNLTGYDICQDSIAAAADIVRLANSNIRFAVMDCTADGDIGEFDVILGMNWIYIAGSINLLN